MDINELEKLPLMDIYTLENEQTGEKKSYQVSDSVARKKIADLDKTVVKTVNGSTPDEDGNVVVDTIETDKTLTIEGAAADAKATGDRLKHIPTEEEIEEKIDKSVEDLILVQPEQPTSENNKIWFDTDTQEFDLVQSVNGVKPDANGNVEYRVDITDQDKQDIADDIRETMLDVDVEEDDDGTIVVSNGGKGSEINYSTEEQVIGTWIDGKPLYQKSFVITNIPTSDMEQPVANLPSDTEKAMVTGGYLHIYIAGSVNRYFGINFAQGANTISADVNNNQVILKITPSPWRDYATEAVITVQYTKTTD